MKKIIPALIFLLLAVPCRALTITVDDDGPADFNNIQLAIDAAVNGDTIIVADGLYKGEGNRRLDFNGKAITLQSENGAQTCIIDCEKQDRGFYFHRNENYSSVLDGFTITNGSQSQGAGIYCYDRSSPTITNCIIQGNSSSSGGAGIYCDYYASPKITNCIIQDNSANYYGGGVYCGYYSLPTIVDCVIQGNSANSYGGGVYCTSCSVSITNCTIAGNSAGYSAGGIYFNDSSLSIANCAIAGNWAESRGGGMYCYRSSATITNCTVTDNSTNSRGGAMYCYYSSPIIVHCTFNGNSADYEGGGIYCGYESSPVIFNSILSNSTNHAIYEDYFSSAPTVEYCLFHNNVDGDYLDYETYETYTGAARINALPGAAHNVDGDPDFAFPDDTHLMRGSECIDRGTDDPPGGLPPTDKDGNPRRLYGGRGRFAATDIGAYEYNSQMPSIALSPSNLEFIREQNGPNPESQTLQIRNCGGGALNWQINEDCPWLAVEPSAGHSTSKIDNVVVSVNTEGLPRGVYTSVLTFNDANAVNSPRSVWVTLRIKGKLYVPQQYPTIQKAIDAAMDGETIEVSPGTYNEYINVNKKLELKGITSPRLRAPVIDATGIGWYAITISADSCIVDSFEIIGGVTGIQVSSSGNIIRNNAVSTNDTGIELSYASGKNTLNNNEILNNASKGLYLNHSGGNILRENHIAGSPVNFQVSGSSLSEYNQDIDISNTVDGKPIYYLVNKKGDLINSSSNAGCVFVVDCRGIFVRDLALSNNGTGVLFAYTEDSNIENITAFDNSEVGILLHNSTNTTLTGNNVSNNNYGIKLLSSSNCTLRSNTCADNVYNFDCEGGSLTEYQHNIDISNTVDGRPIYYLVGKYNITIDPSDASTNAGCFFAVGCSNITVRDLVVSNNGTGVAFVGTSNSSIENVTATANARAGILLFNSTNSVLRGSSISGNSSGVSLLTSNYALLECNSIYGNGLGVICNSSSLNIINSIVKGNSGQGGIALYDNSSGSIRHCTIYGNSYPYGYYPYSGGISCDYSSNATIINSIVWANIPNQITEDIGAMNVTITYSDIQGQFQGFGNINENPLLTPDGHLRAGSPCINRGDPYFAYTKQDMDDEARVYDGKADIGADEYIDTDEDGLPDWWENAYFDPNNIAAVPGEDPDDDGHTNLSEYQLYSSNPTVPCTIYYVDANQPSDSNDGQSWETAKKTIQAAIETAENSDKVLIAPGLYREQVSTLGRELIIQANDPTVAASTIINGTLSFNRGELQGCIVRGLTISNENGTGILCEGTSPTISNCIITRNWNNLWDQGGGVTCLSASPTITNCIISGNLSTDRGGALYCQGSRPAVSNSVITGNLPRYGGTQGVAIYISDSDLKLSQCTIANNEYPEGYSTYGSAIYCQRSNLQISNSILWNNINSQIDIEDSSIMALYSDIKGGLQSVQGYWAGKGNIDVDPCFVDTGYWTQVPYYSNAYWIEGDYHLKSEGWRWIPEVAHGTHWIWDGATSLCIDAGNPGSALGEELLTVPNDPNNDWGRNVRVNMGAYGGTIEASMPPHNWALLGDLTNDGKVDFADLARWAESSLVGDTECPADLDRNASVNMTDLVLLAQDWLAQTSWFGSVLPTPVQPPPVQGPQ